MNFNSCTKGVNSHNTVCKLLCDDGRMLSNGEESAFYACSNGMWVGDESLVCEQQCSTQPIKPDHGQVKCSSLVRYFEILFH